MSRMSNLGDVFQLVIDGLDDGPLANQHLVHQGHQTVLHVLTNRRNQLNTLFKEVVKQWLRDVAFIAKQFAPESLGHMGHRLTVIDIAWCQVKGEQLALVVDNEMQLEAVEPAHRVLATSGQTGKDLVAVDPSVVTDSQGC